MRHYITLHNKPPAVHVYTACVHTARTLTMLQLPLVPFCVFLLGGLHQGLAPLAKRVRGAAPQEVVETEPVCVKG